MHSDYKDIREKIKEEPQWFDSNGVPRYVKFAPKHCPDIYSDVVLLVKIACQYCKKQFLVEMHNQLFSPIKFNGKAKEPVPHYGDPPIHGCVGDTMNCDDIEIAEFWVRRNFKWQLRSQKNG